MDTGEVINACNGEAPEQEGSLFALTLGEMRARTPGEVIGLRFRRDRDGVRRGVDVLQAE